MSPASSGNGRAILLVCYKKSEYVHTLKSAPRNLLFSESIRNY